MRIPLPPPRLARGLIVLALVWYAITAVFNIAYWDGWPTALRASTVLIPLFCAQVVVTRRSAQQWPMKWRVTALSAQTVLTYLPFMLYGSNWGTMVGPLCAAFVLLLNNNLSWALFFAVAATNGAIAWDDQSPLFGPYVAGSAILHGLVIWGFVRLANLVAEVHAMRAELARVAVAQERLRFSRDLHDLLGYSLSAITLKSEVAYRLIPDRTEQAKQEIASVLEVSRQALADARMVSSSYREMRLDTEIELAESVLKAAGVYTEVEADCGRLHPVIDTTMATVLREGVTNILRHSKVQSCSITAEVAQETVRLVLLNDGLGEHTGRSSPHGGSGISNLRTRLTAIGGTLDAGLREDGRFELRAETPLKPNSVLLPDQHSRPEVTD
jgi:two-component system sensor histidine kinase DesK